MNPIRAHTIDSIDPLRYSMRRCGRICGVLINLFHTSLGMVGERGPHYERIEKLGRFKTRSTQSGCFPVYVQDGPSQSYRGNITAVEVNPGYRSSIPVLRGKLAGAGLAGRDSPVSFVSPRGVDRTVASGARHSQSQIVTIRSESRTIS
jgi:hypothetical protein